MKDTMKIKINISLLVIGFTVLIFFNKFSIYFLSQNFKIINENGSPVQSEVYKKPLLFTNDTASFYVINFLDHFNNYPSLLIDMNNKYSNIILGNGITDCFGFIIVNEAKVRYKSEENLYGYSETEFKKDTVKLLIRNRESYDRIYLVSSSSD
jgi:hypothetical protein